MGFEGFRSSKLPLLVRHRRSKSNGSFPHSSEPEEDNLEQSHQQKLDTGHLNGINGSSTNHLSKSEIQNSLSQEIPQLEKRLQDQVSVRCAMEKALGYKASSHYINETAIPKSAAEAIKEIAVLELEVEHLEHHLLSLYRKAFDPQFASLTPSKKYGIKSPLATSRRRLDFSRSDSSSAKEKLAPELNTHSLSNSRETNEDNLVESAFQRSHSTLSQRSAPTNRTSLRACHSQPLSMMEDTFSNVISLAEHLGTRISDHVPETPNKISEEMVKCMCNIYYKLADPPLVHHSYSSPTSSLSSVGAFSPKFQTDFWSPGFRNDSSFDVQLDNPFQTEGLNDFSGPYSTMIEVNCIYRNRERLNTDYLLRDFRSLITRLEEIDPGKMTLEEKLAFWINVHNALVMHAFLAYGIPENNMKRMFLLMKAAYNVGGQIVSADVIKKSILGCRMLHPGQWLRLLFASRTKFKASDARQAYVIERSEPLLHFALSAGSHSDPAVRTYTPKRVYHQLEAAKEEYIGATFGIRNDKKIVLPKIVEYFGKESGICTAEIIQMIQQSLPESLRKTINRKSKFARSSSKNIEWVPHNFSFRYLILKELVK